MSIDRIGKGSGPTSPTGPGGVAPASGKRAFSVEPGQTSGVGAAASAAGPSPAERVRSGELSMNDYLDLRVREATQHLETRLAPADLSRIQQALREQLSKDPLLQELVKGATGQLPPADEG